MPTQSLVSLGGSLSTNNTIPPGPEQEAPSGPDVSQGVLSGHPGPAPRVLGPS